MYDKAGLAPWFDMLNHSPNSNCEFIYQHATGHLIVKCTLDIKV